MPEQSPPARHHAGHKRAYAQANNDQVPLGCLGTTKTGSGLEQNNYFLSTDASVVIGDYLTCNTPVAGGRCVTLGWGFCTPCGMLTQRDRARFFLLSLLSIPDFTHQYNVPGNPWPPTSPGGSKASYSCRSSTNNVLATSSEALQLTPPTKSAFHESRRRRMEANFSAAAFARVALQRTHTTSCALNP